MEKVRYEQEVPILSSRVEDNYITYRFLLFINLAHVFSGDLIQLAVHEKVKVEIIADVLGGIKIHVDYPEDNFRSIIWVWKCNHIDSHVPKIVALKHSFVYDIRELF